MSPVIFNLMDFDNLELYQLVIMGGPYSGASWELRNEIGLKIPGIVSYSMQSNSVSEVHKIVFTRDDQNTLEFAVVGVSQCQNPEIGKNKLNP